MDQNYLSDLIVTGIKSVNQMYNEKGANAKTENRKFWGLIYKYEGETEYTQNGEKIISNCSHVIIIPKGSTYQWKCVNEGHYYTIEFESNKDSSNFVRIPVKNSSEFVELLKDLEFKKMQKSSEHEIECIRDFYNIILKALSDNNRSYVPSDKKMRIKPSVDYMLKNYDKNLTNDSLADLSGLSTVYFRKLFTEIYGTSPIVYVQKLRMKKAKQMLRSDFCYISDIALSLGFKSVYDFSRTFKKHVGYSPTEYAKLNSQIALSKYIQKKTK